ncbi:2Fe-2S iron-sulfur cluster-binding protein [Streptomyces sp. NPDC101118]|uniref:2Fe-2S iron-sulfur cluster-binding protein n=1 Tax=Streptomyces sp. NPDC101118 TaxID=3366109 RepID=UPI0038073609
MSGNDNVTGSAQGSWGWQPVPHGGDYDADATAFVKLPDEMLGGAGTGEPLEAPGHGYVPPVIVTSGAGTDPAATGTWSIPVDWQGDAGTGGVAVTGAGAAGGVADGAAGLAGAGADQAGSDAGGAWGTGGAEPSGAWNAVPSAEWPEAGAGAVGAMGAVGAGQADAGSAGAGAWGAVPAADWPEAGGLAHGDTAEWRFPDADGTSGGAALTGQWSIPVARGDLPEESGEYTRSTLAPEWAHQAPATLPGGAAAPWAEQLQQWPVPSAEAVAEAAAEHTEGSGTAFDGVRGYVAPPADYTGTAVRVPYAGADDSDAGAGAGAADAYAGDAGHGAELFGTDGRGVALGHGGAGHGVAGAGHGVAADDAAGAVAGGAAAGPRVASWGSDAAGQVPGGHPEGAVAADLLTGLEAQRDYPAGAGHVRAPAGDDAARERAGRAGVREAAPAHAASGAAVPAVPAGLPEGFEAAGDQDTAAGRAPLTAGAPGLPDHGPAGHEGAGQGGPAHGTPPHGTSAYGLPDHGTPAHGTPAYGTPTTYGLPDQGFPAQGTPPHGTPAPGTPPHGTPLHPGAADGFPADAEANADAVRGSAGPDHAARGGHPAPKPTAELPPTAPRGSRALRRGLGTGVPAAAQAAAAAPAGDEPVQHSAAPDDEARVPGARDGAQQTEAPRTEAGEGTDTPAAGTPADAADPAAVPSPEAAEAPEPTDGADSRAAEPPAEAGDGTPEPRTEALAATPAAHPEGAGPADAHHEHPHASYVLRVNGADRPVTGAWIGESLLYVLRERLGLAGAKDGCSQGECGACAVQVDGRLVASCLVPAATAAGSEVRTVEGLAQNGRLSDVQQALCRSGAVQCGFCVPGMAMTIHDLLEGNHAPSELETRQALCGNLCRCSGYQGVIQAVREVVAEREEAAAAHADPAPEARIPHQAPPGAGGIHHDGGMA